MRVSLRLAAGRRRRGLRVLGSPLLISSKRQPVPGMSARAATLNRIFARLPGFSELSTKVSAVLAAAVSPSIGRETATKSETSGGDRYPGPLYETSCAVGHVQPKTELKALLRASSSLGELTRPFLR